MRFGRKEPVIRFETSRGWKARDPLLDLVLRRDVCGREAVDRRWPFRIGRAGDEQQESAGGRAGDRRPNARGQPPPHRGDATPESESCAGLCASQSQVTGRARLRLGNKASPDSDSRDEATQGGNS